MKIAAYNILAGGFSGYGSLAAKPERLELLRQAIQDIGADIIGLSDTFRWRDVFSEQGVRELFGYEHVCFIDMNDVRVDKRIGVAVLIRIPVEKFETVRLATRDCIKSVVQAEGKSVAIYTTYLDDLEEKVRAQQATALLQCIAQDAAQGMESVVIGDLNMLTPEDAAKKQQVLGSLKETGLDLESVLADDAYHKAAFEDLYRAEALPLLFAGGLVEPVGAEKYPTAFTQVHDTHFPFPAFRLDHILHSSNVVANNFTVHTGGIFEEASDHYPISCELS